MDRGAWWATVHAWGHKGLNTTELLTLLLSETGEGIPRAFIFLIGKEPHPKGRGQS